VKATLTKVFSWLGDGGRKLIGLVAALVALKVLPKEAYPSVAILYGAFVGGNAVERWSNRAAPTGNVREPLPPVAPTEDDAVD